MVLSRKAKEAIKLGLSMVLVYAIAMQLGWEKPFWAALTVATASVLSTGQSLSRATMRAMGTAIGSVASLGLIALFPQERWLLFFSLSVFLSFCTYMMIDKPYQYFWFLVAMTGMLIMVAAAPVTSQSAFYTAVMRTSETAMGALVYGLVAIFVWPIQGVGRLHDAAQKLIEIQAKWYRICCARMLTSDTAVDIMLLRAKEVQLSNQVEQALISAEDDSPEVQEVRHEWRQFYHSLKDLQKALDLWPETFSEVEQLKLNKLLPTFDAFNRELDRRFEQIEKMLINKPPCRIPQVITLVAEKSEMQVLNRIQKAAVEVTVAGLNNIESLTRSAFELLADIKGFETRSKEPEIKPMPRGGPVFDPDRLRPIIVVVTTLWVSLLLWIYVNPPGSQAFVLMAVTNALVYVMVDAKAPYIPVIDWLKWWGFGLLLAGFLYFLVLPHLSSFTELAILIFAANFAIYYIFGEPLQLLPRMLSTASFAVCLIIDNQQAYSFSHYITFVFMIMGGAVVAAVTKYMLQVSPGPEKDYLRFRNRFLQRGEMVMALLRPDGNRNKQQWMFRGYLNDLLSLPQKLAVTAKFIDYRMFPTNRLEQVQAFTASIETIALKINMLVEAYGSFQVEKVSRRWKEDFQSCRTALEALFHNWAKNRRTESTGGLQEKLAIIEKRINQSFAVAGEGEAGDETYNNFYRLLIAYRGLSEAMDDYAEKNDMMDWSSWRQERF